MNLNLQKFAKAIGPCAVPNMTRLLLRTSVKGKTGRVIGAALVLVLLLTVPLHASFIYEIEIQNKKIISKMVDEALMDTYIDVLIELEAAKEFHNVAGFSKPQEYQQHKDLIRYRVNLMLEIKRRDLDVPSINP